MCCSLGYMRCAVVLQAVANHTRIAVDILSVVATLHARMVHRNMPLQQSI